MDLEQLDNWVSLVRALIACALIWCVSSGLGCWLTAGRMSLHVSVILGLNCMGLLGLVAGWLPSPVRCGTLIGLAVPAAVAWSIRLWRLPNYPLQKNRNSSSWVYATLVTVTLAVTLGPALTYPSGWDELTYHLELPRRWSQAQGLTIQSDLPYSALPSLCECLFTSQQARFAIPLAVLVMLASCHGMTCVRMVVQGWLRIALVLLTLISIPWTNAGYYIDSWLCVLKARQPFEYLRDGVGDSYLELTLFLAQHVQADEKIVTLFEHRLTYLPPQVEIATPYFQSKYFKQPPSQTPESLIDELHEHGIKYVIVTTDLLGPDICLRRIETQQKWFKTVDQCLADGTLQVVWKSSTHAVAAVN